MDISKNVYPKKKVINQYAQFGGVVGGTFLWLTIVVPDVLFNANSFGESEVLGITNVYFTTVFNMVWLLGFTLIFYVIFGFILGLLPSLFTGWILSQIKAYRSYKGLIISLVVGGFMGFTFLSVTELPFIIQALTGGISALILAIFVLPRV